MGTSGGGHSRHRGQCVQCVAGGVEGHREGYFGWRRVSSRLVGDEVRKGGVAGGAAGHSSHSFCGLLEGLWVLPSEGRPWVVWSRGVVWRGLF